jgi:hypothetical protein
VTYRVRLSDKVLGKLGGFPLAAMDTLVTALAAVADDPYDVLHSLPAGDDMRHRWAVLDEAGFIEFDVNDAVGVVTVVEVTWTG